MKMMISKVFHIEKLIVILQYVINIYPKNFYIKYHEKYFRLRFFEKHPFRIFHDI